MYSEQQQQQLPFHIFAQNTQATGEILTTPRR